MPSAPASDHVSEEQNLSITDPAGILPPVMVPTGGGGDPQSEHAKSELISGFGILKEPTFFLMSVAHDPANLAAMLSLSAYCA